jgi:hypothetical protein
LVPATSIQIIYYVVPFTKFPVTGLPPLSRNGLKPENNISLLHFFEIVEMSFSSWKLELSTIKNFSHKNRFGKIFKTFF